VENTFATKEDLLAVIENEAHIRVDSFIQNAIDLAEEAHSNLKRDDGESSFLETHIWPVTIDVIRHYNTTNKFLTSLQIVSSILHDIMEDDEKILDLYASKSYGFDAYFRHRFGEYVYNVSNTLKTKPLENYQGKNEYEKQTARFLDYCATLAKSDYDIKIIKLCDRLNNMKFISQNPNSKKITRYLSEAEDFYIAFSVFPPTVKDFYIKMKESYNELKTLKIKV
jgi:(p)ppGpp synthase/HD superfamily hydrolase